MTMEQKIKVLMVVFNLSVANGVSSYVMNYFRNLDHNKIIMDFVVYQDVETPYYKEIRNYGGHIFKIPSIKNLYSHMNVSRKIILQGHYDIVHDNILILSCFIMHYAKNIKFLCEFYIVIVLALVDQNTRHYVIRYLCPFCYIQLLINLHVLKLLPEACFMTQIAFLFLM